MLRSPPSLNRIGELLNNLMVVVLGELPERSLLIRARSKGVSGTWGVDHSS